MINNNLILNVYEKNLPHSKISTQLLYGDKFKIIKKFKNFYKIKTLYDGYIGYIRKKKFTFKFKPTHKISLLKANLYSKPDKKFILKKKISFCSYIQVSKIKNEYYYFDKFWIKKKDVVPINKKVKIFKNIKIFKNVKYKWGGNSFQGIDCSALVQIFYKFNNVFCPRDTVDQVKFFKKTPKISLFKKNNIIFWKGHVAICLSNNYLIHAYGPKKKVVIMKTQKTINEISKKSNLNVKSIKNANS